MGKWYDIPGRAVDSIKSAIEETKDYDEFFLNFCVNYDGQEEIVDACKLVCRQVKAGKLEVESITKELIKENLYSSYYLPPDLIIKSGKKRSTCGFLLWDSAYSEIYFMDKYFPECKITDFLKAIDMYRKIEE